MYGTYPFEICVWVVAPRVGADPQVPNCCPNKTDIETNMRTTLPPSGLARLLACAPSTKQYVDMKALCFPFLEHFSDLELPQYQWSNATQPVKKSDGLSYGLSPRAASAPPHLSHSTH